MAFCKVTLKDLRTACGIKGKQKQNFPALCGWTYGGDKIVSIEVSHWGNISFIGENGKLMGSWDNKVCYLDD